VVQVATSCKRQDGLGIIIASLADAMEKPLFPPRGCAESKLARLAGGGETVTLCAVERKAVLELERQLEGGATAKVWVQFGLTGREP
jgi:hypothetical protein